MGDSSRAGRAALVQVDPQGEGKHLVPCVYHVGAVVPAHHPQLIPGLTMHSDPSWHGRDCRMVMLGPHVPGQQDARAQPQQLCRPPSCWRGASPVFCRLGPERATCCAGMQARHLYLQSMAPSSMPRPKLPWCELCWVTERWYTGRMWMCAQNSPQPVRYLITSAQQGSEPESLHGGKQ